MRARKGAVPFILGLVIIIIVTVLFVLDKTVEYDERIQISSSAMHVYATVSGSEELKRATDSAVAFNALELTSIGDDGGGFSQWTKESPTMDDLVNEYTDELESRMSELDDVEVVRNMTVQWRAADLELEIGTANFSVKGKKHFVITRSTNPSIVLETDNNFYRTVDSTYFRLLETGRNMFEEQRWEVQQAVIQGTTGAMGDKCEQLTNSTYSPVIEDFLKYSFQCGLRSYDGLASLAAYDEDAADTAISDIAEELGDYLNDQYGYDFNITAEKSVLERTDSMQVTVIIYTEIEDKGSYVPKEGGFESLRLRFSTSYVFDVPKASPE